MARTARTCAGYLALLLACGCASAPMMSGQPADGEPIAPPTALARTGDGRPVLAVALSGGGSKAAPFALGVLEQLVRSGQLREIDVVSSVSGGGYAALFLYSRAADIQAGRSTAPASLAAAFDDCLPRRYLGRGIAIDTTTPVEGRAICPAADNAFVEGDPYRFQNYLRGFQNLSRADFDFTSTSEHGGDSSRAIADIAISTAWSFIPHHIANSLFDWDLRLSPSAHRYDKYLLRTWGYTGAPLTEATWRGADRIPLHVPEGGMTFQALGALIARSRAADCAADGGVCGLPAWYINATAATTAMHEFFAPLPYTLQDVFHFSADSYGSDRMGIERWADGNPLAPRLSVAKAVAASAAFADPMPDGTMSPTKRLELAAVQHTLNVGWGHFLPNYTLEPGQYHLRRGVHALLPFPFYLLHHNGHDKNGVTVRISDGGRSENLGAYSALRAGATDLIIVDAAQDATPGGLEDLCNLRRQLQVLASDHLKVGNRSLVDMELDGLAFGGRTYTLAQWCALPAPPQVSSLPIVRQWPDAALRGCILARPAAGRTCAQSAGDTAVRVVHLKPVIPGRTFDHLRLVGGPASKCLAGTPTDKLFGQGDCEAVLRDFYRQMGAELPPEVAGYLLVNDGAKFPQSPTISTTYSSSPFVFGAYRELGRQLASALVVDPSNPGEPIAIRQASP